MEKTEILKHCRYYKGEDENPFKSGAPRTFWQIEKIWDFLITDSYREGALVNEFLAMNPSGYKEIESIPMSLKAIMYDQYCHWYATDDGFEDWLFAYLDNIPL